MAYYFRKNINDTANDVKLKMQIAALTLKFGENYDKIDDLVEVDKNIKNDISSNTTKINTNESDISSNLEIINSIEENNLRISNNVFNDKCDTKNQLFNFDKNIHLYRLFEKVFENNINGELTINAIINYKYDNLENDINRLTHLYEFYNNKNVLFYTSFLN